MLAILTWCWRSWRYRLALFFHVQCYDTIATIGLSKCSLVCTSYRDSNTIPNYWFTEITIHFCICILALIYSRTILCENQSNDAIASINSFDSLLICTSSSIDLTIPFERIAEFSLSCVTIYSYTWVWIWGTTVLSQYESNDAIATISSYVFLIIGALCAICDAIPCVSFIAEFSPGSITIDSLTWSIWSIWSYWDSINSSKLHEHAALFLINQSSELVVGYLYSSHASKHIVLVCSYRSSVLAVSINLRNDSNGIVVNIVINEEVDYILVIQTCNIQLVECIQLYIRQFHHLPIQYRNVCALFWAARLIWCWIIWIDDSLVIYTDCHIASSAEACIARQVAQIIAILFDHLSHLLRFNAYDDRI